MAENTRLPSQGVWINSDPSSSSDLQYTGSLILELLPSKYLSSPPHSFHPHYVPPPKCLLPLHPWLFPGQEWRSTTTSPVLNLPALFFEAKLRRALLPPKSGEAAWLTFQNWSLSGSSRKSTQRPHLDPGEIWKTTKMSIRVRAERIPECKLLPGNRNPGNENKKE